MTGIKFVIDEKGEKSAVMIDLKKHGKLWEDFYDAVISKSRANEPRETLSEVKSRLKKLGKLNANV
jgi:heterodisulfide reductase subunit A-like polyferredoxin